MMTQPWTPPVPPNRRPLSVLDRLAALRRYLHAERAGGATVVRIERVLEIVGTS